MGSIVCFHIILTRFIVKENEMKPSQLRDKLLKCMKAGLPVLIKGSPGVGKSDIVAQVSDELEMDLFISHPVVSDPTDYKGLPGIVDGQAEFLPFGDLLKLIEAVKPTVAFLDDLGQAPACVQAAAMQLLLARRVNGHCISNKVVFVAATNRREDRAGVTGILEPVKSRFATILELTPDEGEWAEWAFAHDMPGKLIAFGHFRPGLLNSFKPTSDIINSPCPRTFANAGHLINAGIEDLETLSGAVGEGCAIEMTGFFKYWNELPNLDALIMNPDKAEVPKEPAALYAVVTGLVEKVTKQNVGRIFKYGARLPKDFNILLGRDCLRKDKSIQHTKSFIEWTVANKDVFTA
jgi:hypothetical protein